jgi:acyl carrier protein
MSEQILRQELKQLIADVIETDEFNDTDSFVEQLGVDSVMVLEMVARIEKRYRIRIPEESFSQLQNLNAVVQIVAEIMQVVAG